MAEDHDKNESESKSNEMVLIHTNHRRIVDLERLVKLLQEEIEALQRCDNTGFKHQNDGGWFD